MIFHVKKLHVLSQGTNNRSKIIQEDKKVGKWEEHEIYVHISKKWTDRKIVGFYLVTALLLKKVGGFPLTYTKSDFFEY